MHFFGRKLANYSKNLQPIPSGKWNKAAANGQIGIDKNGPFRDDSGEPSSGQHFPVHWTSVSVLKAINGGWRATSTLQRRNSLDENSTDCVDCRSFTRTMRNCGQLCLGEAYPILGVENKNPWGSDSHWLRNPAIDVIIAVLEQTSGEWPNLICQKNHKKYVNFIANFIKDENVWRIWSKVFKSKQPCQKLHFVPSIVVIFSALWRGHPENWAKMSVSYITRPESTPAGGPNQTVESANLDPLGAGNGGAFARRLAKFGRWTGRDRNLTFYGEGMDYLVTVEDSWNEAFLSSWYPESPDPTDYPLERQLKIDLALFSLLVVAAVMALCTPNSTLPLCFASIVWRTNFSWKGKGSTKEAFGTMAHG